MSEEDPYADEYSPPVKADPAPKPDFDPEQEPQAGVLVPDVLATRYFKDTGLVRGHLTAQPRQAVAGATDKHGIWVGSHINGFTHYVDVNSKPMKIAERPTIPEPTPTPAPWVWDITELPEGTTLTLQNKVGDVLEITDLSEPLTLTDPGTYSVEVEPPAPYVPLSLDIEVPDA